MTDGQGKPASRRLLIAFAIGLLLLALIALVLEQHPVLVGGLAVLAVLLVLAAFFGPRMSGEVSAGLQGFRFNLVESIVQQAPAEGASTEELAAAIRKALSEPKSVLLEATVGEATAEGLPGVVAGEGEVPAPPTPPKRKGGGVVISHKIEVHVDDVAKGLIREARGSLSVKESDDQVKARGKTIPPTDGSSQREQR